MSDDPHSPTTAAPTPQATSTVAVVADLDLDRQAEIRRTMPSLANRRPHAYQWPSEVPA